MTFWEAVGDALISLIPPVLVGGIFYVIMRSILRADSKEREVYSQIEAEERAKLEQKTK
jgi:preprotein translocase subunit YajC